MNVLLFSGGLDSTSIAYWKRPDVLLFVDYGQIPAGGEYRAARKIADEIAVPFERISIDASHLGSGELVGKPSIVGRESEYWPLRNQFLITIAAMRYERSEALNIFIGTVASDKCHPDGTGKFLEKANALLNVQGNMKLEAPAQHLTSADLIEISQIPSQLLGWAFSCHQSEYACGQCRGCSKHFEQLSQLDFTPPPSAARQ